LNCGVALGGLDWWTGVKPLTAPVHGAPWQVHSVLLQAPCTFLVLVSVAELAPFNKQT
jgi:hypothetical protein